MNETEIISELKNYKIKIKKYCASLKKEERFYEKQFQLYSIKKGYSVYCNICRENIQKNKEIIKQLENLFPNLFHKI